MWQNVFASQTERRRCGERRILCNEGMGCDFVLELGKERRDTEIRLLQLTDMQIIDAGQSRTPDRIRADEKAAWIKENVEQQCYQHIRSLVTQTCPDLIFITGDVIYGEFDDSGRCTRDFIRFMDSFQIPWTLVFGNHDNETAIGVEEQCRLYASAEFCLFRRGTVTGNSNFSIGISCGEKMKRILYMIDSNGCRNSSDPSVIYQPGIYPDQLQEIQQKAIILEKLTGKTVPGFLAFHIPVDVYGLAELKKGYCRDGRYLYILGVNTVSRDGDFGYKLECCDYIHTEKDFLPILHQCGIDGVFSGHCHRNSTCISYDGIKWVYGLKTGQYDYHVPGQLGGTLVTLSGTSDEFKVQHVPSLVPLGLLPKEAPSYCDFFVRATEEGFI